MRSLLRPLAALALAAPAAAQALLPPGFHRETVATGFDEPTSLAVADDGRVFVGERGGAVRLVQDGVLLAEPVVVLDARTDAIDRGLLGLVLAPDFAASGHLYVHHVTSSLRGRVTRVTVAGAAAVPGSEVVVWEDPVDAGISANHFGGGMAFAPDGTLYVATGDQNAAADALDPASVRGKVLRMLPDGGAPPDNPTWGDPGAHPLVWARGLRNPLRLRVDPLDGTVWIGDVGGNDPWSTEEVLRGAPGASYGWPDQDGSVCVPGDCSAHTPAVWEYAHDDPKYTPYWIQGSITLGPVYRGAMLPAEYQGNVLFGDYTTGWLRRLVLDAAGAPVDDPLVMHGPDAGTLVDLAVAPDGALYQLTVGISWTGLPDIAALYRIAYDPALTCGWTAYGPGTTLAPANVLQLAGAGPVQPGTLATLSIDGLGEASSAWLLASASATQLALAGGVLLADLAEQAFLLTLPATGGATALPIAIPPAPELVGLALHYQAAAPASDVPFGLALSNGLRAIVCP